MVDREISLPLFSRDAANKQPKDLHSGIIEPPTLKGKPYLVIMDGHAMVFRSWFAMQKARPLTVRATGEDIRGAYSFTNTFFKMLDEHKPTHVAIAFDPPGPTFRHEKYPDYKATRPPTPEGLIQNVDRVKQIMSAFNIPILETPGFEADDVIGTIATWADSNQIDTLILSGDTDLLQLVSPHVRVSLTTGFGDTKIYDVAGASERYGGLEPDKIRDVKALTGDTSDNIPGVPGVGIKTAIKLISEFKTVENLLSNLDKVLPPRIQTLIRENSDQLRNSKDLVTIERNAQTDFNYEDSRFGLFHRDKVLNIFHELEFSRMVSKIPQSFEQRQTLGIHEEVAPPLTPDIPFKILVSANEFSDFIADLTKSSSICLEAHGDDPDPMRANLMGIAISLSQKTESFYIPLFTAEQELTKNEVLTRIQPYMENLPVIGHDLNHTLTLLANNGVNPSKVKVSFDTLIAAHLAGQKNYNLKPLIFNRLNIEVLELNELTGTGKKQIPYSSVPLENLANYSAANVTNIRKLEYALKEDLKKQNLHEYNDKYTIPALSVLVQMQVNGITVDQAKLEELNTEITAEIALAQKAAFDAVGHEFNINSPSQLSNLLFNELKLPPGRRTQSGYSTDAAVLENLRSVHPVIDPILRHRELSKLKSTYVDALPDYINPHTRRIHTTYNQAGSATGRLASSEPNLQNIPIRTALGLRVREAFVPQVRPDWTLLSADYSQIDLRALAHLSQDPALLAAFENDEDIHSSTASLIYGVPISEVTRDMRRLAKVMNFGVAYGLSAFGISQQTELSREEGTQFIESYFSTYSQVKNYLDSTINIAKEKGYVETLLGRRRYVPELKSPIYPVRQAGERIAVNMPVQGTSADIINEAMVKIQNELNRNCLNSKMILQVHDELVFEIPTDEETTMRDLLKEIMPNALKISVPLKIDIKSGENWASMSYD
ncbi:MAG: DNA polymerase I [Chloroflexi bacterium]|nr:DNA polymerase I [Chloroflexota bacterium]|tara:strand:- start:2126 stop:4960 length:2835 start_codon:yes stop_codon:yes gene_type:complete